MNSGWALFLVIVIGFAMFFYLASNWKAAMDRKMKYFGDGVDGSTSTENSVKKRTNSIIKGQMDQAYEFNQRR